MTPTEERYANPYLAGAALGVVLFAAFALTGHGLGASGATTRLLVAAEKSIDPRRVDRNPYLARFGGGRANPLDHWLLYSVGGVLLGGLVSGLLAGRWRLELRRGVGVPVGLRVATALTGGAIVGYAAGMARGCSSGQGLSGGATLAVGSWAFMFAMFGGGYLVAWPLRRLWAREPAP